MELRNCNQHSCRREMVYNALDLVIIKGFFSYTPAQNKRVHKILKIKNFANCIKFISAHFFYASLKLITITYKMQH
jgi:hypothetical protein